MGHFEERVNYSVDMELKNMASFKHNSSFGGAIG
jgi:hypothetical protein